MLTLLGSVLGFGSFLFSTLLTSFQDKADKKHELDHDKTSGDNLIEQLLMRTLERLSLFMFTTLLWTGWLLLTLFALVYALPITYTFMALLCWGGGDYLLPTSRRWACSRRGSRRKL